MILTTLSISVDLDILDVDAADGDINQDKAKLLFGANYARLQQIKRKYDPDLVFNKWFPIAP